VPQQPITLAMSLDIRAVIDIIMADEVPLFNQYVVPAVIKRPLFLKELRQQDRHGRSLLQLLLTSKRWLCSEYFRKTAPYHGEHAVLVDYAFEGWSHVQLRDP
jgi:hypothetical protein